jgi:hypothetical protein
MSQVSALLDANIFYPAPTRDLFLQLAVSDLFRARWTADIHREWINALLRHEPQRERSRLERTRELMDRATRDCLIVGYETVIPTLQLPDPDDRHVLAAAISGHCRVIVTFNLADFPARALAPFGIKAQHPDNFLLDQLNRSPDAFCAAVHKVRGRLRTPPYTVVQYLAILTRQGLVATATKLEQFVALI